MRKLVVFGGFLLLAGAGCNPFAPKPEDVIQEMQQNMNELASIAYSAVADFDIDIDEHAIQELAAKKHPQRLSVDSLLPLGLPKAEKKRTQGTLNLTMNVVAENPGDYSEDPTMGMDITVRGSSEADGDFTFGAEVRSIKGEFYVQLTDLFLPGEVQAFLPSDLFVNKWISFPTGDEFLTGLGVDLGPELQELKAQQEAEQQRMKERFSELMEELENREVFVVTDNHGTEKIDGKKTYHYTVKINGDDVLWFMDELEKADSSTTLNDEHRQMIKNITDMLTIDLWIGKKDKLMHKMQMHIDYMDEETIADGRISGTITINTLAVNEPVAVEAPTDSVNIMDLFTQIMFGAMSGLSEAPTGTDFSGLFAVPPGMMTLDEPIDFDFGVGAEAPSFDLAPLDGAELEGFEFDPSIFEDLEGVEGFSLPEGAGLSY